MDVMNDVEDISRRSREPVQSNDSQYIAGSEKVENGRKLCPAGAITSACNFCANDLTTSRSKLLHLDIDALAVTGGSAIADAGPHTRRPVHCGWYKGYVCLI